MAKGRFELEPSRTIKSIETQDPKFAVRIPGGAKSGLIWANVTYFSATSPVLKIYTATDLNLDPSLGAPGGWVLSNPSGLTVTSTGAWSQTLSVIGEYLRWDWGGTIGDLRFSLVVFTYDA